MELGGLLRSMSEAVCMGVVVIGGYVEDVETTSVWSTKMWRGEKDT